MHRISRRMVVILVAVGALAAGGAAYTNSIDTTAVPTTTAGYGQVSVAGATLNDVNYQFNADGSIINGVTLSFTGDLSGLDVKTGFADQPAITDCTPVTGVPAGDVVGPNTVVVCTLGTPETTVGAAQLNISVTSY
jgi:hypothetical protein